MTIVLNGQAAASAAGQARWWLRQQVSRHIEERNLVLVAATALGAANGTTAVSAGFSSYPDDHFLRGEVAVYGGTPSNLGLARDVVAFDGDSGTATTLAFPAQVASGDLLELRRRGPFFDSINQALNEAVLAVHNWAYVPKRDTSVVFVTGTGEYLLPEDFVLLHDVQYEASGDGQADWTSLPLASWGVQEGSAMLVLKAEATSRLADGQHLRLLGYRQPALLISETDVAEVSPNYLIAYATAKLLGNFAAGSATDPDAHASRQNFWTRLAENERRGVRTPRVQSGRRARW